MRHIFTLHPELQDPNQIPPNFTNSHSFIMKMSKLSNQTNSQDPQAVNSRVFVGNLNTFQCSKTDVERMFQKYGRLAGISMHKGYAFVQFTNPFDARNACHGEDGRNILSQVLDVNMVAEPKPHQIGRKRQNVTKTGNDWDYYYDSYYASTIYPTTSPRPIKRQRLITPQSRENLVVNAKVNLPQQQMIMPANLISNGNCLQNNTNGSNAINGEQISTMYHSNGQQQHLLGPFKVYSNPDTLICGNCREFFSDFRELLDHKRSYCKLRFTCKCQENGFKNPLTSAAKLLCAICKECFSNPWDLMVHVQAAHMINIYDLSTDTGVNGCESTQTVEKLNGSQKEISGEKEIQTGVIAMNGNEIQVEESTGVSVNQNSVNGVESPTINPDIGDTLLLSLSSAQMLSSDELKSNDSASSLSSPCACSPSPDQISPNSSPACIVASLSIETTPSPSTVSSIGLASSPVILANGTI